MQYILILYVYYTNAILVEPIKTRSDAYMLCAYDILYDALEHAVHATKLNKIDNAEYTALKHLLQKRRTVVQLVPLHSHIINTAERAIRTFNNHLG